MLGYSFDTKSEWIAWKTPTSCVCISILPIYFVGRRKNFTTFNGWVYPRLRATSRWNFSFGSTRADRGESWWIMLRHFKRFVGNPSCKKSRIPWWIDVTNDSVDRKLEEAIGHQQLNSFRYSIIHWTYSTMRVKMLYVLRKKMQEQEKSHQQMPYKKVP